MPSLLIRGASVHFTEQGSGEPVVLLHSSTGSSAQWRALAERLSTRYRVMAPDLYGYGASGAWRGDGAFALAHEAEIALALLGRAGGRAHLVGHSYGGAVALHVARQRSDLLRSLTLIEPVAFHLLRDGDAADAAAFGEIATVARGVWDALATGDYLRGIAGFIDYWCGAGAWAALPEAKRADIAPRLGKVALDFHAAFEEPTRLQDFWLVVLPTLVVQGGRSPQSTRRVCEQLARVLPDATLETVAGAGHMLPLTHRDPVNALVEEHLDSMRSIKTIVRGEDHASHAVR